MIKAVYPGTFDPLTRGHEDLVRRASRLFGSLVLGIADSRAKRTFFTLNERIDIAKEVLGDVQNLTVVGFTGLLSDFVRAAECARGAARPARGVRLRVRVPAGRHEPRPLPGHGDDVPDPGEQHMFISATLVREIATLGGDVSKFVHRRCAPSSRESEIARRLGGVTGNRVPLFRASSALAAGQKYVARWPCTMRLIAFRSAGMLPLAVVNPGAALEIALRAVAADKIAQRGPPAGSRCAASA
jgi:pantetheine-phosphate adenylyltransferase